MAVWSRLATLGQVSRGFVTVSSEVWAFVQGERYSALVLADRSVRPGQLLELVDQVLAEAAAGSVVAGGADRRLEGATGQRERAAARRFRMPLHPNEREPGPRPHPEPERILADTDRRGVPSGAAIEIMTAIEPMPAATSSVGGVETGLSAPPEPGPPPTAGRSSAARDATPTHQGMDGLEAVHVVEVRPEDGKADPARSEGRAGGAVDIIALAREFAGLLSERDDGSQ